MYEKTVFYETPELHTLMVTYTIITEKLIPYPGEYNSFNFKMCNYHFTKQQVSEQSMSTTVSTHYLNP
jgi:hypothetical protein